MGKIRRARFRVPNGSPPCLRVPMACAPHSRDRIHMHRAPHSSVSVSIVRALGAQLRSWF